MSFTTSTVSSKQNFLLFFYYLSLILFIFQSFFKTIIWDLKVSGVYKIYCQTRERMYVVQTSKNCFTICIFQHKKPSLTPEIYLCKLYRHSVQYSNFFLILTSFGLNTLLIIIKHYITFRAVILSVWQLRCIIFWRMLRYLHHIDFSNFTAYFLLYFKPYNNKIKPIYYI